MRQTQSIANSSSIALEHGFTLIELLVSITMFMIIGSIVSQALVFQSDVYMTDVGRVRVQGNLRSALDFMAVNVRQAGEGFDKYFPALTLTSGGTLTTRRKIIHEVLTACQPIVAGNTQIFVSDAASTSAECIPGNIASSALAWSAFRTAVGGEVRMYVYDQVSKTGEFLDYRGESSSGGSDFLTVSTTIHAYPIRSTSLFILEEFVFSLDSSNETLQFMINGDTTTPQEVAYKVKSFQAEIKLQDGSVVTTMDSSSVANWKDIRSVKLSLAGEESWRGKAVTRSVDGEYFPRNILSQ